MFSKFMMNKYKANTLSVFDHLEPVYINPQCSIKYPKGTLVLLLYNWLLMEQSREAQGSGDQETADMEFGTHSTWIEFWVMNFTPKFIGKCGLFFDRFFYIKKTMDLL